MVCSISRSLCVAALLAAPALPMAAVTPTELSERLARNEAVLLVDVRPAHLYTEGHIPGAINIPLSLLPHKPLPASQLVVVYGDGLGQVDDAQALSAASAKAGVKADILEGGYAAWLGVTRLSTQPSGVTTERLPAITYDQLTAGAKEDVVLVDLRGSGSVQGASAAKAAASRTAADDRDALADFAAQHGLPVVAAEAVTGGAASGVKRATSTGGAKAKAVPATKPGQLLVLVAEDEAAATELARQLRASGHYRFTILIGGVEAIRHAGRTGLGRMDGRSGATQP